MVSEVRRDAGMKSNELVAPLFQRHDRFGRGGSSRSQPPRLSLESSTFNIKAFVEASREIYQDWKSLYTALSNVTMRGNSQAKAHVKSTLTALENEFDDLAERCVWKKKIQVTIFNKNISFYLLLPTTTSRFTTQVEALRKLFWETKIHLIFMAYRMRNGNFLMEFFDKMEMNERNVPEPREMTINDFLSIFTPEYIGCIYKLTSYYIFKRPAPSIQKPKDFERILCESDTEYYINLAAHHLQKAFKDGRDGSINIQKDRNFNYFRLFFKTMYENQQGKSFSFSFV